MRRAVILLLGCVFSPAVGAQPSEGESVVQGYSREVWNSEDGVAGVWEILQDRTGYLWLATYKGLVRFDGVRFTIFDGDDVSLFRHQIYALEEDSSGNLWVGAFGGGVVEFRDGNWTEFTAESGLLDERVWDLESSRTGGVWIGTSKGVAGLHKDQWTSYTLENGLTGGIVWALYEDRAGDLWIGTSTGLNRLQDGELRTYDTSDGLAGTEITAITEDREGYLWVGTGSGALSRFDGTSFVSYDTEELLDWSSIEEILWDRHGHLWLGTEGSGAVRFSDLSGASDLGQMSRLVIDHEDEGNGIVEVIFEDRSGLLWVGSDDRGIVRLNDGMDTDPRSPTIVIEEVLVDRQPVAGFLDSVDSRMSVPPGAHELELRYTGLGVRAPEKIRFRYRLDPYDKHWVEAGNHRIASYRDLPPGEYLFRVSAAEEEGGAWSEAETTIDLELKPSLVQTSWFPWMFAVLIGGLVWSFHRWRLLRVESQRRELALQVAARTEELEAATRELHRLSISDSLTGVANRRRFDQALLEEWQRAQRTDCHLSLLMIDVDCFKQYNDTYGHPQGDAVLEQIARELQASARRAGDLVARYGGEEFAILIPLVASPEAVELAEQIRWRIANLAIPHSSSTGGEVVTVSIGVAGLRPSEGGSPEQLVRQADRALYQAKNLGRDQVAGAGMPPLGDSSGSVAPN